jgi:hypothetical protein
VKRRYQALVTVIRLEESFHCDLSRPHRAYSKIQSVPLPLDASIGELGKGRTYRHYNREY